MITEQQLAAYLAGSMTGEERARFEQELAADESALRSLVEQERMDAALKFLEGGAVDRDVVRRAILEVVSGPSREDVADEVMDELKRPPANVVAVPWRDWLRGRWQSYAWSVIGAAALVALLMWLWPSQTGTKPAPKLAQQPPVVPPLPPVTTPRDPAVWPFAANSPWNTPIGSGAQFGAIQPGGLDVSTGILLKDSRYLHPTFVARPSDPLRRVLSGPFAMPFATLRVPEAALLDASRPMNVLLVAEDGFTLYEVSGAHREGEDLRGWNVVRTDLRGSGIPPELASANGTGLSPLCGSLRGGELTSGIRRVLGAVVPVDAVSARAGGDAHVWPAAWTPDNPEFRARFARTGNVHYGTLLAIPPEVDIAQIGVGTSGPAFEIARALQDYGVYVKDSFDPTWMGDWQRLGSPNLIFCVDVDPFRDLPADLHEKLKLVSKHLKVVVNNGPNSIGGGGTPRRPPAPGFIAPKN
ncbi:MAG: hypothetical protein AB1705_02015 [Verrucomicrobiota bacterium]